MRRQSKWLLPLVFCWSDPDAPRWDLGAVTSERCSASDCSGLVARVNQRNGLLGMRSRTRDVRSISRRLRSDLSRSRTLFSSEKLPASAGSCLLPLPSSLRRAIAGVSFLADLSRAGAQHKRRHIGRWEASSFAVGKKRVNAGTKLR